MPFTNPLGPRHKAMHLQMAAGKKASEVAEQFGVSQLTVRRYVAAYRNAAGLTHPRQTPPGKPIQPKDRIPFIRVRFAAGGTLTVSCGESLEYAASMVKAMSAGQEIASMDVVK